MRKPPCRHLRLGNWINFTDNVPIIRRINLKGDKIPGGRRLCAGFGGAASRGTLSGGGARPEPSVRDLKYAGETSGTAIPGELPDAPCAACLLFAIACLESAVALPWPSEGNSRRIARPAGRFRILGFLSGHQVSLTNFAFICDPLGIMENFSYLCHTETKPKTRDIMKRFKEKTRVMSRYFRIGGMSCGNDDIYYDAKIDVAGKRYWNISDREYGEVDYPTLNACLADGTAEELTAEVSETVYVGTRTSQYASSYNGHGGIRFDPKEIVKAFGDKGWKITEDAVMHNSIAWISDMKSGYRGRDFFLFTPCGCNPLSFKASRLCKEFDWQKTYVA